MPHTTTEIYKTQIAQLQDMAEHHPELKERVINPFINHVKRKITSPSLCRVRTQNNTDLQHPAA